MGNPIRQYETRTPSGLPSWPIGLIAGVEGSGKSIKLAEASASDLIHDTYWIGCGEDDPDEYGTFPGARFQIVNHDGTYRDLLGALEWAVAQPGADGKPNLIVLDSGSRLWHQLSGNAQETANERQTKREAKFGNRDYVIPDDGVAVTMDLWNNAKDRWNHVLDTLRSHQGPSLITSRLELVTVVNEKGEPTKEKFWKPAVEKNTVYEVGFIVQMRAPYPESDTYLTKVKSLRYKYETDRHGKPKADPLGHDWTVDGLWRTLGLADGTTERVHASVVTQGADAEKGLTLDEAYDQMRAGWNDADTLRALMETAGRAGLHGEQVKGPGDKMWGLADLINWRGQQLVGDSGARASESVAAQESAQEPAHPTESEDNMRAREYAENGERFEAAARAATAPKESKDDKFTRCAQEELAFQAEALGVNMVEYEQSIRNADGSLHKVRTPKFLIGQRAQVIDALRTAGKASQAEAYAAIKDGFPIDDVAARVIDVDDSTRVPA